jgi:hypothetical protein
MEVGEKDPKAAVIFTASVVKKSTVFACFFFYDGETPPANAWGKLGAVKPKINLTKKMKYSTLVCSRTALMLTTY